VLRLFRNRDFALLVGGQAVSELGDGIFFVALAWRVYQSYSNPAALSVVGIAFFLPRLLVTVAGGVISDRFERRWTMIGADVTRAVATALLALLALGPQQELVLIVTLVAIQAVGGSLFGPSENALVPQLVSADELGKANSLRTIVSPVAYAVLGPALGGLITAAWGPQAAFWIDAGTYLVSVATLLLMASRPVVREGERRSVFKDAGDGFAYVAGRPWLWGPIITAAVAQFLYAGPNQALIPYVVKFELHATAGALGLVLACGGLGTAAAGLIIGRLPRPRDLVTFMLLGWGLGMWCIALVGIAGSVWQAALAVFFWNLLLWSGEILWLTLLGLTVPNRIRGRVSSIDFVGSFLLIPLSMALTGPLAGVVGARTLLIVAGFGGGLAIVSSFLIPGIRRPQYLETVPA
jgi:DHA3 family tetracycline resistance protein-like MFS transporter